MVVVVMLIINSSDVYDTTADTYKDWLKSFVIPPQDASTFEYHSMLDTLWHMRFEPNFKNDSDRAKDGIELRSFYLDIIKKRYDSDFGDNAMDIVGNCRMLEMLVAVCIQLYDMMYMFVPNNTVFRWFWEIIENLGIDYLTDDRYSLYNGERVVTVLFEAIVNRDPILDSSGCGGFFGLKKWTEKEIWYQMNEYADKKVEQFQRYFN